MNYDNICKYLVQQYPADFVRWLLAIEPSDIKLLKEEYRDDTTIHRYRVVRLWEQDSAPFLTNPALLPLATLTQTDYPQAMLAQVAERVARIEDIQQRQNIAGCAEILAGLRFEKDLIRQFLGEDVMRESVISQDIVQKEA